MPSSASSWPVVGEVGLVLGVVVVAIGFLVVVALVGNVLLPAAVHALPGDAAAVLLAVPPAVGRGVADVAVVGDVLFLVDVLAILDDEAVVLLVVLLTVGRGVADVALVGDVLLAVAVLAVLGDVAVVLLVVLLTVGSGVADVALVGDVLFLLWPAVPLFLLTLLLGPFFLAVSLVFLAG